MADAQRLTVKKIINHHSVGPEFINSSDQTVANWFSVVGKGRGYKNLAHSGHYDPRTGKETFAQAHYALHKYAKDKKYGWRLVPLVRDIYGVITWGASNFYINREGINIETCGTYTNKTLPLKALMLEADTFRAHDKKIGGVLNIVCHNYYSATICPGKICGQRTTVIDMINNPAKWNAKLWPKPKSKPKPPAPKPKPPTKIVNQYVRYGVPLLKVFNKDANLWDFGKTGWSFRVVKSFKKGEEFLAVGEARHSNGSKYLMTNYSFGRADKTGVPIFTNGVNLVDLKAKPVPPKPPVTPPKPPKPKPDPIPPKPPKPPEKPPEEPPEEPPKDKPPTPSDWTGKILSYTAKVIFKWVSRIFWTVVYRFGKTAGKASKNVSNLALKEKPTKRG